MPEQKDDIFPEEKWLSLEETAKRIGLSIGQVRAMAGSETLPVKTSDAGDLLFLESRVVWAARARPWRGWRGVFRRVWRYWPIIFLGIFGGLWVWRIALFERRMNQANIAVQQKNWKEALREAKAALSVRPNSSSALRLTARVSAKTGDMAMAAVAFEKLKENGQMKIGDLLNHAFVLQRLGQEIEARNSLNTLLKSFPDHFYANYLLAQMDFRHGRSQKTYNRLVRLHKRHPSPLLTQTIKELAGVTPAKLPQGVGLGLPPDDPWTIAYRKGRQAQIKGDFQKAQDAYGQVLAHQRLMALTLNNQALILLGKKADGTRQALILLGKAWALYPREWAIADSFAVTALRLKDKKEALLWTQTALKNNPTDPALAFYRRALALQLAGQPKEAGAFAVKSLKSLQKGITSEISEDVVKILIESLEQEKNRLPLKGKKK